MRGVSSFGLRRIKKALNRFLTDTCDIYQEGEEENALGDSVVAWVLVHSGVICRLYPEQRPGSTVQLSKQELMEERYTLIVPYGTGLSVDMRITMNGGEKKYHVLGIEDGHTDKVDERATVSRERPRE